MTLRTYETTYVEIDDPIDGRVRSPIMPPGVSSFRVIKDDGFTVVIVADMDDTQHDDMSKLAGAKHLEDGDILAGQKTDTAAAIALVDAAQLNPKGALTP